MKDANDKVTIDLFSQKRSRGRPFTGCAKSEAERARAYRLRKKQAQATKPIASCYDAELIDALEKLVAELTESRDRYQSLYESKNAENEELMASLARCNQKCFELSVKIHELKTAAKS